MPRSAYESLFEIGVEQHGIVAAAQATAVGVSAASIVMMERRGVLERLSRGVYRLVQFPYSPLAQYVEATLWPFGVTGTISHESALALFEVSDVSPSRIHITVPSKFRVRRGVPPTLTVHRADLREVEVMEHEAVRVTTPVRTLRDCWRSHAGPEVLGQALKDFTAKGFLTGAEAESLRAELLTS